MVSAGDFSRELCGGTHVNNTSRIGLFTVLGEGGIAATGDNPYTLFLTELLTIVAALCLIALSLYYRLAFRNSKTRKFYL